MKLKGLKRGSPRTAYDLGYNDARAHQNNSKALTSEYEIAQYKLGHQKGLEDQIKFVKEWQNQRFAEYLRKHASTF